MGSGCCTTTKIADVSLAVVQTQNEAATKIPYGYVFIYPGVLTSNQTYTCPMLSIHTYRRAAKKTESGYTAGQVSNKKRYDGYIGPVTTSKEEELSSDETVIMIPVEDVINIYYTSAFKKSVKAGQHSRVVPVVAEKGCCSCCDDPPEPVREPEIIEEKGAQRDVTIHLQYSKYSNLDTVSNARILPESDRAQFYKSHFQPNTELRFYLVRNTEYDSANFDQTKIQAENLCRIIMQLKGMNSGVTGSSLHPPTKENVTVPAAAAITYPSPKELQQILNQPYFGIFGDLHQERLHTIQTQQDFGTHVPVPITTTATAAIAMRPTDSAAAEND